MKAARILLVALTAAAVALLGAPPASAADTYYRWGDASRSYYHYNNPALGQFDVSVWVDNWERDVDGDGLPDEEYIRGHARSCKVLRILRVQVDYVRLGNATQGGVPAENTVRRNSGTAPCADSTTAWVRVAANTSCADAFEAWTRGGFSARWSDGRLSSNVTFLSNRSGWDWCQYAATTGNR